MENLTYVGTGNFTGTGNGLANVIEGRDSTDTLCGLGGQDMLRGNNGTDTLYGGADHDELEGGAGTTSSTAVSASNSMLGGADDDTMIGTYEYSVYGVDVMDGGEGTDTADFSEHDSAVWIDLTYNGREVWTRDARDVDAGTWRQVADLESVENLIGTANSDQLYGNDEANRIVGGAGRDVIEGRGDSDVIEGGLGFDTIRGDAGNDTLTGGGDADSFVFTDGWGEDTITDFALGEDILDLTGVSGLDSLSQLSFSETAQGARVAVGTDSITLLGVSMAELMASLGVPAAEPTPPLPPGQTLIGTAGSDTLTGGAGNDRLEGGDGMDFLTGGAGADQLLGGAGTDFLYVDADDTLIDGGAGFDYVYVETYKSYGANFKVAGTNVEYVGGGLADDVIDATGVTYGTVLFGNYGNDVLIGGAGNDRLMGSADNDTLTGGAGNDTFYFAGPWGNDTITDFAHGQDVLDMTGVSGLTSMSQLGISSTAQGASIAYGADSILLQGVTASSLTASDFHFV